MGRTKVVAGVVSVLVLALIAVGGYFAFLKAENTTVTIESAAVAADPGASGTPDAPAAGGNGNAPAVTTSPGGPGPQAVTGVVTPAEPDRVVVLERKVDGAWEEVARVATDATGSWAATFDVTTPGSVEVRAVVSQGDRTTSATSETLKLTVLEPTTVKTTVPYLTRTDRNFNVRGSVFPAAVREVSVERSTDGQTWNVLATGETDERGKFKIRLRPLAAGHATVRVTVAATDAASAARSDITDTVSEDYQAAGQKYLEIVNPGNKLITALEDLTWYGNLPTAKAAFRATSDELTSESKKFKNFKGWPSEIQLYIEQIIADCVADADIYNQLASADSWEEIENLYAGYDFSNEAAPLIREALGLPKRPS